ncbi:UNVERIFIED_CONTAM: hypothetical protein FKN15_014638 [Acipenser sinensis]
MSSLAVRSDRLYVSKSIAVMLKCTFSLWSSTCWITVILYFVLLFFPVETHTYKKLLPCKRASEQTCS